MLTRTCCSFPPATFIIAHHLASSSAYCGRVPASRGNAIEAIRGKQPTQCRKRRSIAHSAPSGMDSTCVYKCMCVQCLHRFIPKLIHTLAQCLFSRTRISFSPRDDPGTLRCMLSVSLLSFPKLLGARYGSHTHTHIRTCAH